MRSRFHMFLRRVLRLLVIFTTVVAILVFAVAVLFLQERPTLEAATPPTPEDVAVARALLRDVRRSASIGPGEIRPPLNAHVDDFNSVVRLGARFIPGARGRLWVDSGKLNGAASLPVPWINGRKWINITGVIPPFTESFSFEEVTLGGQNVPPTLALFAARTGANLIAGNRFGDKVVQSASTMGIADDRLTFAIRIDEVGKNGVMRGTFGMLRGAQMPIAEEVEFFHQLIREAMVEGVLPLHGSFLPYLEFTLSAAVQNSTPQTLPNVYTAAIFGLAKACGARDFAMIVGRLAFDGENMQKNWPVSCDEIVFNGRVDSRRHFITSAALQAASNTGFAISIGEFKELYDTISGAGGFDFTDMAANLSGVRMSDMLMALPKDDWPERLALIETENDVIISFEGIPTLMQEKVFEARFRDVDSPAYNAMLAQIEARINELDLYRGL